MYHFCVKKACSQPYTSSSVCTTASGVSNDHGGYAGSGQREVRRASCMLLHTAAAQTINGTNCGLGVYIVTNHPFARFGAEKGDREGIYSKVGLFSSFYGN